MNDNRHLSDTILDGWIDEALSPGERREAEVHLEACERCQRRVEILRSTIETTRTGLPVPPAAPDLAARIRSALDAEDARQAPAPVPRKPLPRVTESTPLPSRRRWHAPAIAAAAAAAGMVLAALLWWYPASQGSVVEALEAAYLELEEQGLPPSLRADQPAVVERRWQQSNLRFPTRVFDFGAMGIELAGGGSTAVGRQPAAVSAYRAEAGLLVCWMFEGRAADLAGDAEIRRHGTIDFYIVRRPGRTLVLWQEGEVVCALAGADDPETVINLAYAKAQAAPQAASLRS